MQKQVPLKQNYLCPKCNAFLRVWNNIIFSISAAGGEKKGILLLDPKLGNYTVTSHPSLKLEEGEKVDFFCPVCHENLAAKEINENMVRVIMTEDDTRYDVYFSNITGQKSTFKIKDNNIIEKFGQDESFYVNYFMTRLREKV